MRTDANECRREAQAIFGLFVFVVIRDVSNFFEILHNFLFAIDRTVIDFLTMVESEIKMEGRVGLGRLEFFLSHVVIVAAVTFSVFAFGPESRVLSVLTLVVMAASFVLDVLRLKNIGLSPWFAFLRFVPYVKIPFGIGLYCAQANWVESRKLDATGKKILVVLIALVGLLLFLAFRLKMTFFGIGEGIL